MHDLALQVAKTVNERISKYAQVTLESCAYAGTGNVLKVQQLLAQAGEHIELKEDESWKVRQMMTEYAGSLSASLRSVQHPGQNRVFCHLCHTTAAWRFEAIFLLFASHWVARQQKLRAKLVLLIAMHSGAES